MNYLILPPRTNKISQPIECLVIEQMKKHQRKFTNVKELKFAKHRNLNNEKW